MAEIKGYNMPDDLYYHQEDSWALGGWRQGHHRYDGLFPER